MVTRIHKLLAVCLAVASWSLSVACKSTSPKVETRNGTYSGLYIQEFNQDAFLGIPFGQAARLGLPTALNEAWDEVRPATTIGDACLGSLPQAAQELLNVSTSDDCLNLNIVRPSGYKNKLLPVMVWIYGGGFSVGFNGNPNENTSYVIKASVENGTPIMSVSINYRVGFYGFPGGVQATQAGIVNLGLKDQRLALAWIQENIEAFGGDPNKVTLWGQSAGSASIGYQWLAYDGQGAEDLFRGTILVSGGALSSNMLYPTHPNCIEGYENILNVTGCDAADNTLECVKEASVDDVLLASSTAPFPTWWPSIDGDFIVRPPDWQLQMGHFSPKISSIVGANNDEGLLSANVYAQGVETEEDLEQVLKILFPAARDSVLQEVLDAYPADGPNPPYSLPTSDDQFCEAMTEAGLPCPGQYRRVAAIVGDYAQIGARRVQARGYSAGGAKVYSYRFDTNPTSIPIVLNAIAPGFATHSSEYAYFFGFPPDYNLSNFNPTVPNVTSHLALSRGIVDKLVAYIATGDPNKAKVPGFPRWPLYSDDGPKNMVFNVTESDNKLNVHIETDTWRKEGMGLWEKYPVELQFGSNWRP